MRNVYLDHAATTPLDPEVMEAMRPHFNETFGNPSSIHSFGRTAKAALDDARESIASFIGASAGELFFVSGGTEADNFAIKGAFWQDAGDRSAKQIITSAIEHHAVLDTCDFLSRQGCEVRYLPVDSFGMIRASDVENALTDTTRLVSIIHANNEVGSINPVSEIVRVAKRRGVAVHTDAVQSFGKIPINVRELDVDMLSMSAHKIYGPKGIGALFIRRGVKTERFMHGGGQERGRRGGTENVPLAVGFAKAVSLCRERQSSDALRLKCLKDQLQRMLMERFPFVLINGHPTMSLANILSVSFDSSEIALDTEALLFNLDLAGIAVTSGSACTSGSIAPSHVLLAMGRDSKTAKATVRFSLGRSTSEEDLVYTVDALAKIVQRIGRRTH